MATPKIIPNLQYVKMPRNIQEYTLMKGVTDFSNLKQFDLFESGYSFLTVVSTPQFMKILGKYNAELANLEDTFVHIMEGEFRGLDGIPDITSSTSEITNGVNNTELITNVSMETTTDVSMSFYERSGSALTKYLNTYLTGIKDPYSKAKTYHGLIESGEVTNPGADLEVFTFLYYVTDNTMRKIEKAYLLANAQPQTAPNGEMYNSTRGTIEFKELSISFKCYVIMGDDVNKYAAMMLTNDLSENATVDRKLILNSNDYKFDALSYRTGISDTNDGTSRVASILRNTSISNKVEEANTYKLSQGTTSVKS